MGVSNNIGAARTPKERARMMSMRKAKRWNNILPLRNARWGTRGDCRSLEKKKSGWEGTAHQCLTYSGRACGSICPQQTRNPRIEALATSNKDIDLRLNRDKIVLASKRTIYVGASGHVWTGSKNHDKGRHVEDGCPFKLRGLAFLRVSHSKADHGRTVDTIVQMLIQRFSALKPRRKD
jgi:hypothetical protein